jgi:hypothetical protein
MTLALSAQKLIILQVPIQGVPELAPQRKQACADNKSKFSASSNYRVIKFLISPIPETRPQVLLKNPIGC